MYCAPYEDKPLISHVKRYVFFLLLITLFAWAGMPVNRADAQSKANEKPKESAVDTNAPQGEDTAQAGKGKAAPGFGQHDPRLARSLTGLARVALAKHNPALAEMHYKKALSIKLKSFGNENSDVIDLVTELAMTEISLGKVKEARQLIDESQATKMKLQDTSSMPETWFAQALVYSKEGNDSAAATNYRLAADAFMNKLEKLSYPVSTLTMQTAKDCVDSYCNFLDAHKQTRPAKEYRSRIAPINNWLATLGQS